MNQYEIKNLSELTDKIAISMLPSPVAHFFRGHASVEWSLVPSVHREYTYEDEQAFMSRFRTEAPTRYANCPSDGDFARWITLAQHYGLRTRLLDWSYSPLYALYFAILYEQHDGPAAVWQLNGGKLNEYTTGSYGVRNLLGESIAPLLQPAFLGGEQTSRVAAVGGPHVDLRMTVQQSMFTLHGDPAPLEEHPESDNFLTKFVIPEDAKDSFAADLHILAVRRELLFPDLSNLATGITDIQLRFTDG